jgi:hypothetical protein
MAICKMLAVMLASTAMMLIIGKGASPAQSRD